MVETTNQTSMGQTNQAQAKEIETELELIETLLNEDGITPEDEEVLLQLQEETKARLPNKEA